MKKLSLVFDFDGVLCQNRLPSVDNYANSKPYQPGINRINEAYRLGHHVRIVTARYMVRCEGDPIAADNMGRAEAEKWLKDNGVSYHSLHFGKLPADMYVDDRAVHVPPDGEDDSWEQYDNTLEALSTSADELTIGDWVEDKHSGEMGVLAALSCADTFMKYLDPQNEDYDESWEQDYPKWRSGLVALVEYDSADNDGCTGFWLPIERLRAAS